MKAGTTGALPVPGPLWGPAPQRDADGAPARQPYRMPRRYALLAAQARAAMRDGIEPAAPLRAALRRAGGWQTQLPNALGCAAAAAQRALGLEPFPTQLYAAAALLDERMVEMATGEGKSLTAALAAAVGALAGMPVHVVTANDYLAARDAAAFAPLYAQLGLRCAWLDPACDAPGRHALHAHDVVYATAKELAFDDLRASLQPRATRLQRSAAALAGRPVDAPPMRGLCMAILDEADSILLDEADIPLVLSRSLPDGGAGAWLWQSMQLARGLESPQHYAVHADGASLHLTRAGRAHVEALSRHLPAPWRREQARVEAVTLALTGLHALRRGEHYLVRGGRVELLDGVTGRAAPGRVWSQGLQGIIELKEGVALSAATETVAQTSFQRYFLRYLRLAGMSGTLREARAELLEVYGRRVVSVPLRLPARRTVGPSRCFADDAARWAAACARVLELRAQGRPVLIGTDSVAASQALSQRLHAAGIEHEVLNALQDRDEARVVALAGQAGRVTVATRMAGRGTDIRLDAAARAAGGLHVIACQHNPSRRLDRQLFGRTARQGDPGSAEAWLLARLSAPATPRVVTMSEPCVATAPIMLPERAAAWLAGAWHRLGQRLEERRRRALRRNLLERDRLWQRRLAFAGPPR